VPERELGQVAVQVLAVTPRCDLRPVDRMPQPGDRHPGFTAQAGECWALVNSKQLQATHCREVPTYTGCWYSPRDDGTWWRVWSCPDHIEELTGIREFGARSR
jgi:hypothetical protein